MKVLKKGERYKDAVQTAWKEVSRLEQKNVAKNAEVEFKDGFYIVPVLNQVYSINPKKRKISLLRKDEEVEGSISVLILHYLIHAKAVPKTNKLITFRELDGGNIYYNAFKNSAINPIAQKFGNDLEKFKEVSLKLGGIEKSFGEMSFEFRFFPRISLIYVLWQGDEEIPSNANILFDSSISLQMHTEDIAVIGRTTTFYLMKF